MTSTKSNHNEFVPAMAEIAREAGALLMEYFHQHVKVEYKGDADLVTIADRKSEILIREADQEELAFSRCSRRGARPHRHRQRLSLVRGPARRNHELRPRIPGILRFDGAGVQEPENRRGGLRSHAR